VAPPHERSNWALGLGLPLFMLGPDRGSFAPLNRTLLLEAEVAKPIESGSGSAFNQLLSRCRQSGDLETMARAGWQHYPIDGFARIAEWLQQTCGGRER